MKNLISIFILTLMLCGCSVLNRQGNEYTYDGEDKKVIFKIRDDYDYPLNLKASMREVEIYAYTRDLYSTGPLLTIMATPKALLKIPHSEKDTVYSDKCNKYSGADICATYFNPGDCSINKALLFLVGGGNTVIIKHREVLFHEPYTCSSWGKYKNLDSKQLEIIKDFESKTSWLYDYKEIDKK